MWPWKKKPEPVDDKIEKQVDVGEVTFTLTTLEGDEYIEYITGIACPNIKYHDGCHVHSTYSWAREKIYDFNGHRRKIICIDSTNAGQIHIPVERVKRMIISEERPHIIAVRVPKDWESCHEVAHVDQT